MFKSIACVKNLYKEGTGCAYPTHLDVLEKYKHSRSILEFGEKNNIVYGTTAHL